ncbi:MAG: AbrB/MazE/SpoVT family DNA-binding domain-containing protein [Candidatus Brockarchaeota archaeon]|nr:AbrB/MazE/SpoVT family DNA-binding domain-containing protein [Candidatus Brockarchaeota archaeon]
MSKSRTIGPKGQVVIPEEMRRALGMKPGARVRFELRGKELVVKPEVELEEYVEYYSRTFAKKARKQVDLKKLIEEEVDTRLAVSR